MDQQPQQLALLKKNANLRDTVARALRAAIISGEMQAGVVYSARVLSERFGVSATPVREAMLDLLKEGLVTTVPNKGFRVTDVSESDLDDITQLRLLIEPPTVRQAVSHIPDTDFPRLRKLAGDIVDFAAAGDLIDYIEADLLFHLELLGYSGNRKLVETIAQLRSHTRLPGLAPLVERGELTESAQEHPRLVTLLEARDKPGVERLMERHIGHVRGKWARPEKPAATRAADPGHRVRLRQRSRGSAC